MCCVLVVDVHISTPNIDLIKSKTCSGPIDRHAKMPHLIINLSNFPATIHNSLNHLNNRTVYKLFRKLEKDKCYHPKQHLDRVIHFSEIN